MSDTVIVASKIANKLKLYDGVELNGFEFGRHPQPNGAPATPDYEIIGGFALTRNVPRLAWERWRKAYALSPFIASGLVFADPDYATVRSYCRANAVLTGGGDAMPNAT